MEMHQVLTERGDLLLAVFGKLLLEKTFMNSIYFGSDGSFTSDLSVLVHVPVTQLSGRARNWNV